MAQAAQPRKGRPRGGFTLIELLVVAAMVATLMAVLLPALQEARVDARQVRCKNNLRQLALAMHNYHDAHRMFPPGWTHNHAKPGSGPRFGWSVSLTPYLDQAPLYDKLDSSNPFEGLEKKFFQQRIDILRCPADPMPDVNPLRGDYGTSNYSGNFGTAAPPRWAPGQMSRFWPGQADTPLKTDGMFWLNSNVRIRDIPDGTSNTLLAGERSVTSGAGIWPGVLGNEHEYDQVTDCAPGNPINSRFTSFSSLHGGGANFVLCDGSVRFISEKIESAKKPGDDSKIYQHLSTRAGGEVVGEF